MFAPNDSHPMMDRHPDVVEMTLPLLGWQVEAMERRAEAEGLTVGQWLRRLIGDQFRESRLGPMPQPSGSS